MIAVNAPGFNPSCRPGLLYDTAMSKTRLPFSGPALITGASSGLGAEFARQLAAAGCPLILVARREDRLRTLAEKLRSGHGVAVEVVPADLASEAGIAKIESLLRERPDTALLVNNAGFGAGGSYERIDMARQLDMIRVHVEVPARLMRAALPAMVGKGSGAIINVASVAAFAVTPKSGMYAATKAWGLSFSRSLALEVRAKGVRVQALCPGFTVTGFHDAQNLPKFERASVPRFLWGRADKVVAASLRALRGHRAVVIPGGINKVMAFFARTAIGRVLVRWSVRRRA
jgi:short-subunit dehydrogenase